MKKTIITTLGVLLLAGSLAQMATASARGLYRAPASEQFSNANNSVEGQAKSFCSQEPGNPYNEQTDYMGWTAFRDNGSWDSRNDCQ